MDRHASRSICDTCDELTDDNGKVGDFIMCPLHTNARALLEALERVVNGDRRLTVANVVLANAAIAQAKGEAAS